VSLESVQEHTERWKQFHEVALCGRSGPGLAFNGTVRWRVGEYMSGRYVGMEEFIVLSTEPPLVSRPLRLLFSCSLVGVIATASICQVCLCKDCQDDLTGE
jgi:hypothetical protein